MIRRRLGLTYMAALMVALALATLAVPLARGAAPTDGCCAKCIGKTSSVPYTYDPLVYAQCSAAGGVCCFNCDGDKSSPTIENASFGDDGETPQVKAGEWIQITWTNVARVTYESYKVGQTKTTTVTNSSAEATHEDSVFFICAKSAGSVVVRGWGSDPCTSATPESKIVVVAGSSNGTCASRTPTAPTSTADASASASSKATTPTPEEDPELAQCNLQRASIVTVDGKRTCVCAAEWTGAPDCAGYPWWKTAATIGGGLAALLSIAVSVKAFMNSRKAKQLEEEQQRDEAGGGMGPVLGEETIRIASDPEPSNRASDQAYQPPPPVSGKARDNKEYTL